MVLRSEALRFIKEDSSCRHLASQFSFKFMFLAKHFKSAGPRTEELAGGVVMLCEAVRRFGSFGAGRTGTGGASAFLHSLLCRRSQSLV